MTCREVPIVAASDFSGLSHGRPVLLAVMAGLDDTEFVGGDDGERDWTCGPVTAAATSSGICPR
jgi:hypothetical protein